LLEFEIHGDAITSARELVYVVDRVSLPPGLSPGSQVVDQGVSEMAVLADGSVITIERAFVRDAGSRRTVNVIRLFRIRLDGADDVSGIASLRDAQQARPVSKDLLLDLGAMTPALTPRLARLENFEAMAPGPAVAGGPSLVLMSDDNFNARQVTAAVVLRY
jgi:3-phytase